MTIPASGPRPGDRVVWTGTGPNPLVMSGTFVADGPTPYVTVQHDGAPSTDQVFADQLSPECRSGDGDGRCIDPRCPRHGLGEDAP